MANNRGGVAILVRNKLANDITGVDLTTEDQVWFSFNSPGYWIIKNCSNAFFPVKPSRKQNDGYVVFLLLELQYYLPICAFQ